MKKDGPIRVALTDGMARTAALGFIRRVYGRSFGTSPGDDFEYIFAALREGEIIGTIAVNFWRSERPIRLSRVHRFIPETAPMPVIPGETIEFGRWIARTPRASVGLIYSATLHAIREARRTGWCEHGDDVHRVALMMGLRFHRVTSILQMSEIGEEDMEFYRRSPSVKLYMINLKHIAETLEDKVLADSQLVLE